jgi:mannosyltransferase OCH1-like enzyme
MEIPKIIYQTWKTYDIPDQWKYAQKTVKEKNKDWKYVLLSDEDNLQIVKKHFPDFLPYYVNFKYNIQRADAIRYMVLYLYGGVYLDLDYQALKPFGSIILENGKEVGFIKSGNVNCITNSFLCSHKGANFWLECIEEMKKPYKWWHVTKHLKIMCSTGPLMIDKVYKENKDKSQLLEITVPCSVCNIDNCEYNKKYYLRGIRGDSWHSWDSYMINIIHCNKKSIIYILLIIILTIIIIYRINRT